MIRGSANETPFSSKLLSEDAMDMIAKDVRERPIAEVGRHVMPLLHHILALDSRECHRCQYWVPYNHAHAHEGECLNPAVKAQFRPLDGGGESLDTSSATITPFDWGCKGWSERLIGCSEDAQRYVG